MEKKTFKQIIKIFIDKIIDFLFCGIWIFWGDFNLKKKKKKCWIFYSGK